MGKKFIPKLCTICSLATVFSVTPALFSCGDKPTPPEPEHEHVLGGYKIDEASHKLYGVCADCGEQFELSDEQFSDIENKVFVKYKGEDKYTLSDTTQNDLTEIVHNAFGSSVDIYLIKGTYMIDETWFVQYHDVEVNIHGILGYHDEKLTTFNCVDSINHPEQWLYEWRGMILTIDNVKLQGLMKNATGGGNWQDYGIVPTKFTAEYCDVIGCHCTFATSLVEFNHCFFDCTQFEGDVEYGVYTWNIATNFNDCEFVSYGKAIKVYSLDTTSKGASGTYNIKNCNFTVIDPKSQKYAIQINSKLQKTYKYQVTIENCSQEGHAGLYTDEGNMSDITVI